MNKRWLELLILLLISTAIMAASSLPNWMGRSLQNEQVSFRGQYFDNQDYAVDIAMMQAGMQGAWKYQMRFTNEEHKAVSIRLFYLALGHVSRVLGLDPESTYGLFRWIFGYLALFSIYGLCRYYFKKKLLIWAAFLLAVFGSGLGWLQLLAGWQFGAITPVDFWLIDAYVLFSLSLFPHFSCAIALMALGLLGLLKFIEKRQWRFVLLTCAAGVLTQIVNPIAFVVVDAAIFFAALSACLKDRSRWKTLTLAVVLIAVTQIPLLVYNLIILSRDPVWSQYTAQNITLSPSPLHYLMGFGLFWPMVVVGVISAIKARKPEFIGLLGWLLSAFILAYLPTLIQRRFLLAITVPLAVIGLYGLDKLIDWLGEKEARRKPALIMIVVLMVSFSSIYLIYGNMQVLKSRPDASFYPANLDPAFKWLTENADPSDFVLAGENTSQLVAQKSGLRVFAGHEMETIHYSDKLKQVASWYRSNMPDAALAISGVKWVFYGPYEKRMAPDFKPGDNLEMIFSDSGVKLYQVK
ncbi:MAG TPA: hypothetical protein DIW44_10140 [Anaerolineaceae bacterium]|nr:hypothetical protein [Anaerolineaceae bacterium]